MGGRPKEHVAKENILLLATAIAKRRKIERCEADYRQFFRAAWGVMEPGVDYVHGWHIDAIAEHLEAVLKGEIRKLIINISPRSSKSTLCAVGFPAYTWIQRPEKKFLFTSYDLRLSFRDSRKCRSLIKSAWYQENWGQRFKIVSDQDEKRRFDNDKMGYRMATSTDAGTTGEGADLLCYDDPNDVRQMTSEAYIESVIYYHEQVMASRLNDPKTGCRILIQQRCSERDLTGHILEKELNWERLVLPMEYEGDRHVTGIGWSDPRTKTGELMCPERIGPEEITDLKRTLGTVGYVGQYQQRPAPGEGDRFKREWWNYWTPRDSELKQIEIRTPGSESFRKMPVWLPLAFEQVIQSWDMTFKDSESADLVAAHVWGRIGANFYLIARKSERMDFPATLRAFRGIAKEFPCPEKLVEDKANGPAVIATLKNEIPGIIPINPDGGKLARAAAVAPYVEAGNVFLPNPQIYPWVWEFVEQHANFPRGKHDDDVDALTQALRRLSDSVSNGAAPEFRVTPRPAEPASACHVEPSGEILRQLSAAWPRRICVSPGPTGAVLWMAETPSGALRVYRELDISGLDAYEAGRQIAEASRSDVQRHFAGIHTAEKLKLDVFLEKEAFAVIPSVGSYAELLEQGIIEYAPTEGPWEVREALKARFKQARFAAEQAVIEDGAWDRLRDLLRFKPPDFEEMDYDRERAFRLAEKDIAEYNRYMAMVSGRVDGEYPKIKFSSECHGLIAGLGAARQDEEISDPYLRALLIGVSAQAPGMPKPVIRQTPWSGNSIKQNRMKMFRRVV